MSHRIRPTQMLTESDRALRRLERNLDITDDRSVGTLINMAGRVGRAVRLHLKRPKEHMDVIEMEDRELIPGMGELVVYESPGRGVFWSTLKKRLVSVELL